MAQGLNGWFGRFLKKAIQKAAKIVDDNLSALTFGISRSIGSFSAWADELGSGGGAFMNRSSYNVVDFGELENDPRGDYEPSLLEEDIIDRSIDKIAVIISSITEDAIAIENGLFDPFAINQLLNRMNVLKAYYYHDEVAFLSKNAIDFRDLVIDVLLQPSLQVIENKIAGSKIEYKLNSSTKQVFANTPLPELSPFGFSASIPFTVEVESYVAVKKYIKDEAYTGGPTWQANNDGTFEELIDEVVTDEVVNEDIFDEEPQNKPESYYTKIIKNPLTWLVGGIIAVKLIKK